MLTVDDLLGMCRRQLREVLTHGHAIDPRSLDDSEYKGLSLGLPRVVERLTWKQFKKIFVRDPKTDELRGYNMRIRQEGIDAPWRPLMRKGEPITFGHFQVVEPSASHTPIGCDRGLMIDYSLGTSRGYRPLSHLRDPIVAVNAGCSELLLGWSYLQFGRVQLGTPSFFSLQRDRSIRS